MISESLNSSQLIDGVQGNLTVELRDAATGKTQELRKAHNFVSLAGKRHLEWIQRAYYFKNGISTLNPTLDVDYQPPLTQDHIVLSSLTAAASPSTEWQMFGKLIGYAGKYNYSGTDTFLGTPNISLCEATPTYAKWVFDWPTHAGNGTIGSVGWMNSHTTHQGTGSYGGRFYTSCSIEDKKTTNATAYRRIARKSSTEYFFAVEQSTTIVQAVGNFIQNGGFSVASQFKASTTLHGITWDGNGNKLWVLGLNSSNVSILASYSAGGSLQDGPFILPTTRAYKSLGFDGTNLWTMTSDFGTFTAYCISPSGTDVSNFTVTLPATQTSSRNETAYGLDCDIATQTLYFATLVHNGYAYDGDTGVPMTGSAKAAGALRAYDLSGNEAMVPVSLWAWNPVSANRAWLTSNQADNDYPSDFDIVILDSQRFLTIMSETQWPTYLYGVWRILLDGMGSRALLPSPVTKTNSQTLRITYQMDYT